MIIPGQFIAYGEFFKPTLPRSRCELSGMTYGVGPAGYDVRIAETIALPPGGFALASTVEEFDLPTDVLATIHDKSTLARMGLAVQTTVAEPGWRGNLTLELTNHRPVWQLSMRSFMRVISALHTARLQIIRELEAEQRTHNATNTITLQRGQPIAQVLLHRLEAPTDRPYAGRYQDQPAHPMPASFLAPDEVG